MPGVLAICCQITFWFNMFNSCYSQIYMVWHKQSKTVYGASYFSQMNDPDVFSFVLMLCSFYSQFQSNKNASGLFDEMKEKGLKGIKINLCRSIDSWHHLKLIAFERKYSALVVRLFCTVWIEWRSVIPRELSVRKLDCHGTITGCSLIAKCAYW